MILTRGISCVRTDENAQASWTGLLDFRRLEWCADLLSLLPCLTSDSGRTLPDLADYDDSAAAGRVVGRYARRWPELQNARLFLGLGDGACANVGSGCRDDSVLAATVGTSAAARVVVEAPGGPQAPASQIKVSTNLERRGDGRQTGEQECGMNP